MVPLRKWSREAVVGALLEWRRLYGALPTSYDLSATHARRRGGEALARLESRDWPPQSAVTAAFGGFAAAREAAEASGVGGSSSSGSEPPGFG